MIAKAVREAMPTETQCHSDIRAMADRYGIDCAKLIRFLSTNRVPK